MIVVNLPQFPFRGIQAPYLWMFYKALSSLRGDTHYFVHQDYLTDPSNWAELERWELHENNQRNLGYQIPALTSLANVSCSLMPDEIFGCLLARTGGNPLKAFEQVLLEVVPDLSAYYCAELEALLKEGKIDAILSPINCPSLQDVARLQGIPLIYFELGPLRGPGYVDLAYFDFQGLNEKAEFAERYAGCKQKVGAWNSMGLASVRKQYLRGDYWVSTPSARATKFDVGVSMQIEDDTNLIASSNGFSNQGLIAYSKLKFPDKRIAYKAHPGSLFNIKPEKDGVDYNSGNDFLFDCDAILTINSSMGFEALLWGKQAHVLGSAAYAHIATMSDEEERNKALRFYLRNYLVPFELVFSREYINFRLTNPNEGEIEKMHLSELVRIRTEEMDALRAERDEQVTQLYGVVAERDALIGNLGQTVESLVLDRDSQKAGIGLLQGSLEKLAQERDEQVTQLYGVVAEREQSILSLRTENETLGKELSNVYGSRSWRLTSPMRKLAYFMKRIYGIFFGRLNRYDKLPLPSYEKPEPAQNLIDAPLSVNAQLSASDSSNRYRILLVSYYCPTRAHAGGLRILDIYALIRQQRPDVRIDLLTHHRPTIDGSIDNIYQIFDNVYLTQADDLSPRTLVSLRGGTMLHYDLVDLQFHQSAYQLDAFRQVATKVIFTPMESQAKALFLDIATKFKSGKGVGFTRIASLINLAAEEISFCRKADEVVCVSRTDASFLRAVSGTRRIRGIDTGISKFEFAEALEPGFLPDSAKLKKLKIIYIAYFGSETNVIALKWFLENVHPAIKEKVPDYVLTVVGRGDLSGFETFRGTSVELVGEVPAIAPYISEARVGIAPALSGSGLRGKVNQYAVLGLPCVVSPIALKGLAYRDGKNVCVAETPNDFADGCIRLLTDLELNDRIATAARQLCMDRYSWQSKWPQIRAVYGIKNAV